ncbi:hypothetical protein MKY41_02865 [Sporosarcina sp. FSL W7-1349]|uniref:hypothetical protein n=1 Tax=Sporosarcina sp. FSL W7-1349 TaxID=2921561 RepID=UPI0030F988C8
MRLVVYSSIIILYIISRFIESPLLSYSIGILAVLALLVSVRFAKGLYFVSGIVFLLIGIFLFFQSNLPWTELLLNFETMLGMLSLFLFLPFINSLIRVGGYDKSLSLFLDQGITKLKKLYTRSFFVTHLLGLFLNIATIPLLSRSLDRTLNQFPKLTIDKFKTQSLLRSYALCLSWSPMEIMVSISLDMTNNTYLAILPILLFIAFLLMVIDLSFTSNRYQEEIAVTAFEMRESTTSRMKKKVSEMIILLIIFISAVSVLQNILNKGYLFSIVLLLLPISIGWAILNRRTKRYFQITIPHWIERTNNLPNYFFMFLSAGFFVAMLTYSGHLAFLQKAFIDSSKHSLLFFCLIALYFIVSALIGFHPLVSITLIAQLLQPILPEVSSISLTLVLIASSVATVMYSPYNLSLSILAEIIRVNPYRIGWWNIPFALLYMGIAIGIAYLLTFF